MPNFKLRQLEGFVAAADSGSFTKAASQLAMTPPAFSQLIRELEGSLNVSLFDRTTRRVELTDAGRQLLQSVRRPLEDLSGAYVDMKDLAAGGRGRVVFSVLHSLAFTLGTESLAAFKATHPQIKVQMIEDQNEILIERVMNREIDFGLGMLTFAVDELAFAPLFEDELVVVFPAGHRFKVEKTVNWSQLATSPLVLLPRKSSVRHLVDAALAVVGNPREPVHEVVSMVTAMNMVAAGFGVTVIPELSLRSLKMAGFSFRKIGPPAPRRKIGLIRRANRIPSSAEVAFIAELKSCIKAMLPNSVSTLKS